MLWSRGAGRSRSTNRGTCGSRCQCVLSLTFQKGSLQPWRHISGQLLLHTQQRAGSLASGDRRGDAAITEVMWVRLRVRKAGFKVNTFMQYLKT